MKTRQALENFITIVNGNVELKALENLDLIVLYQVSTACGEHLVTQ
jgi:hypothetical protein